MGCGYSDNLVKAYKSSFFCGLGCERWHHSHLRNDPEYKNQISNNLGREMFNSKLPKDLEVSQKEVLVGSPPLTQFLAYGGIFALK